jgi:pilus assembly protein CpaB
VAQGRDSRGAIRTLAEAEGRVVRSAIVAGEPLLESRLAPELAGRGGVMAMLVPEGQRGVSIKVDEAIRESGFILPNSRVDVLVSMSKPGSQNEKIAKVILQDVPILAAGQTVEMRDNKPITVTTVTLALTPEQTERLAVAQSEGRITLTTRNLRDNQHVRTPGATQATLLSDAARPAVAAASPTGGTVTRRTVAAAAPLPAPTVEGHTVSVVRGSRLTEQQFIKVGDRGWMERAAGGAQVSGGAGPCSPCSCSGSRTLLGAATESAGADELTSCFVASDQANVLTVGPDP